MTDLQLHVHWPKALYVILGILQHFHEVLSAQPRQKTIGRVTSPKSKLQELIEL